jgi:hypothetical protein
MEYPCTDHQKCELANTFRRNDEAPYLKFFSTKWYDLQISRDEVFISNAFYIILEVVDMCKE